MADHDQNVKSPKPDKSKLGADLGVRFSISEKVLITLLTLLFSFMGVLISRHNQNQRTLPSNSDSRLPSGLLNDIQTQA